MVVVLMAVLLVVMKVVVVVLVLVVLMMKKGVEGGKLEIWKFGYVYASLTAVFAICIFDF